MSPHDLVNHPDPKTRAEARAIAALPPRSLWRRLLPFAEGAEHPWTESHYDDWPHEDLVWRILFLQGAARTYWNASVFAIRGWLPLAFVLGIVVGLLAARLR